MNNTSLTALGGIISALSVFIMFLSGIFPFMMYVIPMMCGPILIITIREAELKWSFFIYCAVSVLSLLVVADKEAAVMYTFFFGLFPVVKELLDTRVSNKIICFLLKLIFFNVSVFLAYLLLTFVLGIPIEEMEEFGKFTYLVLLGMGNLIFLMYDNILGSLNYLYMHRWHKRIAKIFGLKK